MFQGSPLSIFPAIHSPTKTSLDACLVRFEMTMWPFFHVDSLFLIYDVSKLQASEGYYQQRASLALSWQHPWS
jgi:hypothetical protein